MDRGGLPSSPHSRAHGSQGLGTPWGAQTTGYRADFGQCGSRGALRGRALRAESPPQPRGDPPDDEAGGEAEQARQRRDVSVRGQRALGRVKRH